MIKKTFTLISAILIMLCIGGVYAWSIFVNPLKTNYGLTTAQTQYVFGLTIATFTIAMILAGKLEKAFGAKISTFIGFLLFTSGYLMAYFSNGSFLPIFLGIGVLSGAGIGFCYLAALVTPVKWFPDKKGIITGISVAGFGGGAILLSNIVKILLSKKTDVLQIFLYIGVVYGLIIFISLLFLSAPKVSENSTVKSSFNIFKIIFSKEFFGLFFGMFAGTFAGLMIVGNLKPIGLSFNTSENIATLGITLLAIGNMSGRVIWGHLSDKLHGKISASLALALLSVATLLLLVVKFIPMLFLLIALIIGMGFGANFVVFAHQVSDIYGTENLGLIYPFVFLSYGFAGLSGPSIGGFLFDKTNSYFTPIIVSAVICSLGLLVYSFLIKKPVKF